MLLVTAPWFKWLNTYSGALLFVVAAVTGVLIYFQVREAARLRREQAQPYVAVDMRSLGKGKTSAQAVELVVKNFGATAAHDIRLESDPPLVSSDELPPGWGVWGVFDVLPTLVPGQEWSTLWEDEAADRTSSDLPQVHDVTVRCKDSRGREMDPITFRLDWSAHKHKIYRIVNGVHEIHAELEKIRKDLDGVKNGQSRIKVLTQDESEYQARVQSDLQARYEEFQRLNAQQEEQPPTPEQPEEG